MDERCWKELYFGVSDTIIKTAIMKIADYYSQVL